MQLARIYRNTMDFYHDQRHFNENIREISNESTLTHFKTQNGSKYTDEERKSMYRETCFVDIFNMQGCQCTCRSLQVTRTPKCPPLSLCLSISVKSIYGTFKQTMLLKAMPSEFGLHIFNFYFRCKLMVCIMH